MRDASELSEPAIDCRFLIDGEPARAFAAALAADVAAARLSLAFRAYYRVRSLLPISVRQMLQRRRRIVETPDWYLPGQFASSLAAALRTAADDGIPVIHPWPDGAQFAFVPTHDVETAEGMRNIERIANLEEDLGFRSSWNIVPHKYAVDRGLLRDLQDRGFEIGVHGYNHDGKLFTNQRVFHSRVPAINAALKAFRAVGFRAPMVHRNLQWLQQLDIEYDASYFDVDPYQAMPGGIGSMWPFVAGKFVELPYTLPQDHTLFVALGKRDGSVWERKLEYVAAQGGMALFITHPDYLDSEERVGAYRRLLERARTLAAMWHALPHEIARWWRQRDVSLVQTADNGTSEIHGPAAERGRVARMRCAVDGRRRIDWARTAPQLECAAATHSRP